MQPKKLFFFTNNLAINFQLITSEVSQQRLKRICTIKKAQKNECSCTTRMSFHSPGAQRKEEKEIVDRFHFHRREKHCVALEVDHKFKCATYTLEIYVLPSVYVHQPKSIIATFNLLIFQPFRESMMTILHSQFSSLNVSLIQVLHITLTLLPILTTFITNITVTEMISECLRIGLLRQWVLLYCKI